MLIFLPHICVNFFTSPSLILNCARRETRCVSWEKYFLISGFLLLKSIVYLSAMGEEFVCEEFACNDVTCAGHRSSSRENQPHSLREYCRQNRGSVLQTHYSLFLSAWLVAMPSSNSYYLLLSGRMKRLDNNNRLSIIPSFCGASRTLRNRLFW